MRKYGHFRKIQGFLREVPQWAVPPHFINSQSSLSVLKKYLFGYANLFNCFSHIAHFGKIFFMCIEKKYKVIGSVSISRLVLYVKQFFLWLDKTVGYFFENIFYFLCTLGGWSKICWHILPVQWRKNSIIQYSYL